ncbi:CgeB family protein [Campylobacter californiensis]|uniref:CgeB family protein n=1 Tax=Campylobacter californiensis TaxID=1032243 RepID=UPI0014763D04|nr:glycosyltransferase [Campylobacter sp. RM12916]MBE3609027.1 glycosyltransferase [Campylobacter sp. RM12916]
MKILYVDLEYDYGIKARGINTIGQYGFKYSFEKLGHEVVVFYYDEYLNNIDFLQKKIKNFADDVKPDLIFFCMFQEQFEVKTLDYLKSKYLTINWFGDDQWRFDNFTCKYANCFTYCITTDKFSILKYKKLGQHNVIYSQWGAINSHDMPKFEGYKYDVSFIGGFHPYRKWFIDTLIKRGIKVKVFGNGWMGGALSSENMNKLFILSKINLNISNSVGYDIRYMSHKPSNFLSTIKSFLKRGSKNMSQMKARNFEIPYFNGFQLTDYVPTLEDYFDIGKEVVCYNNVDEAELLIKYYLQNEDEREKIKKLGHKKAINQHGYIHRFKGILEQIK